MQLARAFILNQVLGQLGTDINSVLSEVESYNFSFRQSTPANAYAAALAMVTSDNTATAVIGNEGWITVGGDLTVHSLAEDPFQISMSAHAGAVAPASDKNFGAALAYSKDINQANAFIAWNAVVDVQNTLDVTAEAKITSPVDPLDLTLAILGFGQATQLAGIGAAYGLASAATTDDTSFGHPESQVKQAIDPPVADLTDDLLGEDEIGTSFIHAGGSGGDTTLGGAINLLFGYNAAHAGIAAGAHVNQRAADLWSDPGALDNQDVLVNAVQSTDMVHYAGNPSVLGLITDLDSTPKTGIGGFFEFIFLQSFAEATIADQAVVSAGRDVKVNADSTDD